MTDKTLMMAEYTSSGDAIGGTGGGVGGFSGGGRGEIRRPNSLFYHTQGPDLGKTRTSHTGGGGIGKTTNWTQEVTRQLSVGDLFEYQHCYGPGLHVNSRLDNSYTKEPWQIYQN